MACLVSLARRRAALNERMRCTSLDDRTAAEFIPYACDCTTIHCGTARATDDSAFPVERAKVAMADEDDRLHGDSTWASGAVCGAVRDSWSIASGHLTSGARRLAN